MERGRSRRFQAAIRVELVEVPGTAAHAFLRDEGPRYNPALATIGHALVFELFGRKLRG
jgi:hypothetical protein